MTLSETLMLVATSLAALAAIVSGFMAWRQHVWNKKNHLASVRPFLSDFLDQTHDPLSFTYTLTNKGLGPALINGFKVTWDGKAITMNDLQGKLNHQLGPNFVVRVGDFNEHFALSIGEVFVVLHIEISPKSVTLAATPEADLEHATNRLLQSCRLEVQYRSFLSDEIQTFRTTILESLAQERGLVVKEQ